jgi:hypothetical protein
MKDFSTMKPREVESYLREVILSTFGDGIENSASVTASKGYYTVAVEMSDSSVVEFKNFRKKEAKRIAKAIRALKENV